jgi:hypothetical protein
MTDEIRRIATPPEVMRAGDRSLLPTVRHARRALRTDPDLADDLLTLAHSDARQIVEDADLVIKAARANSPGLRKPVNALAEGIEGELDADDDADAREPVDDGE